MAPANRTSVGAPTGAPTRGLAATSVPTLVVAAAAALGLGASLASARFGSLPAASGPVLCPFRAITGLPCPTCGMSRSWVALAEGDLSGSIQLHPMGVVVLAMAMWLVARTALHLGRREDVPSLSQVIPRWALVAAVSAIVVFGCARLAASVW